MQHPKFGPCIVQHPEQVWVLWVTDLPRYWLQQPYLEATVQLVLRVYKHIDSLAFMGGFKCEIWKILEFLRFKQSEYGSSFSLLSKELIGKIDWLICHGNQKVGFSNAKHDLLNGFFVNV